MTPRRIGLRADFGEAWERLKQADEHCDRLKSMIDRFIANEPSWEHQPRPVYFEIHPDLKDLIGRINADTLATLEMLEARTRPWGFCYQGLPRPYTPGIEVPIAFSMNDHSFATRCGVVLGDIIHGYRSALDNMVWEATEFDQTMKGNPPPEKRPFPKGSPWRKVAFPYKLCSSWWKSALEKQLWGIQPDFQAVIQGSQPFASGQSAAHRHPLYILSELSNIDKHHRLNILATRIRIETAEVHPETVFTPKTVWELENHAIVGTLTLCSDDAIRAYEARIGWPPGHLSQRSSADELRAIGPDGIGIRVYTNDVDVNLTATFEVALGEGTPASGSPLWETLIQIQMAAWQVYYDLRRASVAREVP